MFSGSQEVQVCVLHLCCIYAEDSDVELLRRVLQLFLLLFNQLYGMRLKTVLLVSFLFVCFHACQHVK